MGDCCPILYQRMRRRWSSESRGDISQFNPVQCPATPETSSYSAPAIKSDQRRDLTPEMENVWKMKSNRFVFTNQQSACRMCFSNFQKLKCFNRSLFVKLINWNDSKEFLEEKGSWYPDEILHCNGWKSLESVNDGVLNLIAKKV